jgi:hypothetical protein
MSNIDKIEARVQEVIENNISSNKERIDLLLKIDADNVAELGKNSTSEERKKVKRNSLNIYRAIKKIDKIEGELLLKCVDK